MSYYFVVVSHRDTPLYEAHLTSTRAPPPANPAASPSQASFSVFGTDAAGKSAVGYGPKNSRHVQQLVAHASLDVVEDVQWSTPYMYLRSVDKFREWTVSSWVTPGGIKLILLHEAKQDDPIRHFLHEAWEAYVKVLLNPFYEPGGQIRSPAFDAKVKASAKKHL